MNKGDIVRIKPNFGRPSRVGQTAKIIAVRKTGNRNKINQYFVQFEKDGQPDWINEYDLELVVTLFDEEPHGKEIEALVIDESILIEEPQKRTLDL